MAGGRWVVTAVAAALAIGGASTQNVALVHWTSSSISAFGVLFVSCLYFLIAFTVLIGTRAILAGGDWRMFLPSHDPAQNRLFTWPGTGQEWTMAQLAMFVGLLGTANSMMNVYATPPSRTPPLVQSVLLNAGVLFAVPLSKAFLGDNKRYCSLKPAIAATLIIISVTVSLLPALLYGADPPAAGRRLVGVDPARSDDAHALTPFLWSLVYLFSNLPWAADCIVEQAFLMRAGAHDDDMPAAELATVTLRLLFWQALWQVIFMWAAFAVDLLPWFGFSGSLEEFKTNTIHAIVCSVAGSSTAASVSGLPLDACVPWAPVWAVAMSAGYVISYIADAVLIRVSASLSMLNYVLITAVTSCVWLIPGVNPAPENTPLWSVIVSVVLSAVGLTLWTRWENEYDAESSYTVITPKRSASMAALSALEQGDDADGISYSAESQPSKSASKLGSSSYNDTPTAVKYKVGPNIRLGPGHSATIAPTPHIQPVPEVELESRSGRGNAAAPPSTERTGLLSGSTSKIGRKAAPQPLQRTLSSWGSIWGARGAPPSVDVDDAEAPAAASAGVGSAARKAAPLPVVHEGNGVDDDDDDGDDDEEEAAGGRRRRSSSKRKASARDSSTGGSSATAAGRGAGAKPPRGTKGGTLDSSTPRSADSAAVPVAAPISSSGDSSARGGRGNTGTAPQRPQPPRAGAGGGSFSDDIGGGESAEDDRSGQRAGSNKRDRLLGAARASNVAQAPSSKGPAKGRR